MALSEGPDEVAPHFLYWYFDSGNVLTGSTLFGHYVLTSKVSSSRKRIQTLLKAVLADKIPKVVLAISF